MPNPSFVAETNRLEAFSDGVFAIIITIMVLELKVPHETNFEALIPLLPVFLSYLLSFVFLAIYWNNHHHLLQATEGVTGGIMWGNMHLLFWLSLVPFATTWLGESHGEALPAALYGGILLMAAFAYYLLQKVILTNHAKESALVRVLGKTVKEKLSLLFYFLAIAGAFLSPLISYVFYVLVALMWIVPDRRLAEALTHQNNTDTAKKSSSKNNM